MWGIVDRFGVKLLRSGYALDQVRKIVLNGIKGYESRVTESKQQGGRRLHQSASQSMGMRMRKKLLGKSEWFKTSKSDQTENVEKGKFDGIKRSSKMDKRSAVSITSVVKGKGYRKGVAKTRSVMFVENTCGGILAKGLREILNRLSGMLGSTVKVVESSGSKLQHILSNTNPWAGSRCERKECIPCGQAGGGRLNNCKKRGVLYESHCKVCNPEGLNKNGVLNK